MSQWVSVGEFQWSLTHSHSLLYFVARPMSARNDASNQCFSGDSRHFYTLFGVRTCEQLRIVLISCIEHHGNNHRQIFDTCFTTQHTRTQRTHPLTNFLLYEIAPNTKNVCVYFLFIMLYVFFCSQSFYHKFRWSRMKKYFCFFFNQNNE